MQFLFLCIPVAKSILSACKLSFYCKKIAFLLCILRV